MNGMINRAIQCFVRDTYGVAVWSRIVAETKIEFENFEAMLSYPESLTMEILQVTSQTLVKPVETLLEDIGTYLVSHPNSERLRRLLRFGGSDFAEFMFSLNELEGRARLALPDLKVPIIRVRQDTDGSHTVLCSHSISEFGYVFVGVMRAMADDYGALVYLEHEGWLDTGETVIKVQLLEAEFSEGRRFDLAASLVSV